MQTWRLAERPGLERRVIAEVVAAERSRHQEPRNSRGDCGRNCFIGGRRRKKVFAEGKAG